MFKRIVLPLIALMGIGFCIFMIYYGARKPPVGRILFQPPVSPYKHYIAGEGIIESINKNIQLSSCYTDLITEVFVKVGDFVKCGQPLLKLDTRPYYAALAVAVSAQEAAQKEYDELKIQFSFYERLKSKTAVSEQAYNSAYYGMQIAQAKLQEAIAQVNVVKVQIERAYVIAPFDGEILQVNARPGQYANVNPFDNLPLMLFGDTRYYHLRVDIDEEDAWRVIKGSPATAYLRGNAKIAIPLEFAYAEPYVIPKVSLSGADTERVDTRVLQLLYKFPRDKYPVYAGQLLDVYVEAKSSEAAT